MRALQTAIRQGRWRLAWIGVLAAALAAAAAGQPLPAQAALDFNEWIPFVDDFDACTGERVSVEGTQHIVGRITQDGKGRLHFGFTRNTHGTGIGYASGDRYVLTDSVARSSFEPAPGEVKTYTEGYHERFIHLGEGSPGDDTLIYFLTHITVNANGEVTAAVEIQDVVCN